MHYIFEMKQKGQAGCNTNSPIAGVMVLSKTFILYTVFNLLTKVKPLLVLDIVQPCKQEIKLVQISSTFNKVCAYNAVIVLLFINNTSLYLKARIWSMFVLENCGWSVHDISFQAQHFPMKLHRGVL